MTNRYYAACSFGLEAVVAAELRDLGIEDVSVRDGRVYFSCGLQGLAQACMWLSAADRVYMVLAEFPAETFDALFEGVKAVNWEDYLPKSARFPVLADSVRSVLKSVPDIQRISKKAVVEALRRAHGLSFYRENGTEYGIYISLLADTATAALNVCGQGLNRRGYRVRNSAAPLRETLAAGLIRIARWRDRPFYDPTCGSGTIAIEAAMKARRMAPGLNRSFACEAWGEEWSIPFASARQNARDSVLQKAGAEIFASDIDGKMVEMAQFHARRAGVAEDIVFEKADVQEFAPKISGPSTLISNPPYAIRIGDAPEVQALYAGMGRRLRQQPEVKAYILTADAEFERAFGKRADKKRKLYNGNIKCCYYQYFR